MRVTVATAVEGWEAATPYVLASTPAASLASTSTSTDTNNRWEEVLEEVMGPDGLFNSLEALLEDAL